MRNISLACAAAVAVLASSASGQQAPHAPPPCTADCVAKEPGSNYDHVKVNILKSADKMPADSFSFKPTPDVRTFARVLNHISEAQETVCSAVIGAKPAAVPPETADKATIVAALNASFSVCDKAYASVTDANMAEVVDAGPFKRSRLGLLWGNAAHDSEQYATLALYLRLKGLVPPSSEK